MPLSLSSLLTLPKKVSHGSGEIFIWGLKRKETLKIQHAGCTPVDWVFRGIEKVNWKILPLSILSLDPSKENVPMEVENYSDEDWKGKKFWRCNTKDVRQRIWSSEVLKKLTKTIEVCCKNELRFMALSLTGLWLSGILGK